VSEAAPPGPAAPALTARSLLGHAAQVWRRHWGPLLVLALTVGAIWTAAALTVLLAFISETAYRWLFPVALVLGLLVPVVVVGGATRGVFEWLAGRPASLGQLLRHGVRALRMLWLLVVLNWLASHGGWAARILADLVACALAPVMLAERIGVVAAARRCLALTRGHRRSLLAALLAIPLLLALARIVGEPLHLVPWAGEYLTLAPVVAMASFLLALPGVAYHDLRRAEEGAAQPELPRVFE